MEVTKTYVEYMYPGSFMSEYESHVAENRDPKKLNVPKSAFGFKFYDQTSKKIKIDGKEQTAWGARKKESGIYYPSGQVFTAETLRALKDGQAYDILIYNMECNGWKQVVRTRRGNFQPLETNDVIL